MRRIDAIPIIDGFLDDVQVAMDEGDSDAATRIMDKLVLFCMEHLDEQTVRYLFVDP